MYSTMEILVEGNILYSDNTNLFLCILIELYTPQKGQYYCEWKKKNLATVKYLFPLSNMLDKVIYSKISSQFITNCFHIV